MKRILCSLVMVGLFVGIVGMAYAKPEPAPEPTPTLNLTTTGAYDFINGARYEQLNAANAGTGNFDPFLSLSANGVEQAYNTSGRSGNGSKPPFDAQDNIDHTHNLQLSDIANNIVTVDGINYYEFLLDINQNKGGNSEFLSLDQLQIYFSTTGSLTTTTLSGLGTKIYDLDFGADNWVKLNAELSSGSGVGDMRFLLPTSLASSYSSDTYLYMYSQFGTNNASNDGFEEWGERGDGSTTTTPEPATMALMGMGLAGLLGFRRKRA